MKATEFAYWLQGVFELGNVKSFDEKQTDMIRNHLAMVFLHDIDPSAGSNVHQTKLSEIHEGKYNINSNKILGHTPRC